ncbi:MAG: DNA gyrase subunit A, partial [Anaerotignum sp.]|nr:DNA gyrase subunit A [Anaerotignum sp.]
QYRGGKGLKIHQLTEKTGELTGVLMIGEKDELMLITSEGVIIRLRAKDISSYGRVSQGVKLMNLDEGVSVVGIAKISEEDIEESTEEMEETVETVDETEVNE